MEALIMTGQLLLGLSILVGLHELGHLLAAKAFGMRVEKYSIGFPPKIWGKQIGETEYSFGAIPLGGFVKISGMIDESLATETMSEEPEPWEFRAKPAWQRLIVMLGGIIVNVITGIFIFIALTYSNGQDFISKEELNKAGIVALDLGQQLGLQTGDIVLNVSGRDYETFSDLRSPDVLLGSDGYYTVKRGEETLKINIPNDFIDKFSDNKVSFIEPRRTFVVGEVREGTNAEKGGLKTGDKILAAEGTPVNYYDEYKAAVDSIPGGSLVTTILRDGQEIELAFDVSEDGTLGFIAETTINFSHKDYTFGESVNKGTAQAFNVVFYNIKAFGKMFSGDVSPSKSLSHVVFLTWEIVTGRKPSDKFLENAQKVGMVLLLGIMSYAILNDVYKLF